MVETKPKSTPESRALAAVVGRLWACAAVAKVDYGDGFLVSQMKLAAREILEVELKLKERARVSA